MYGLLLMNDGGVGGGWVVVVKIPACLSNPGIE